MAKIKITPLRSFFDNGKGFFVGKKYSVDEERAQAYLLEGWAEVWSEEKYGAAQTDGGDDDDDLTGGQGGGGEGSGETGANGQGGGGEGSGETGANGQGGGGEGSGETGANGV